MKKNLKATHIRISKQSNPYQNYKATHIRCIKTKQPISKLSKPNLTYSQKITSKGKEKKKEKEKKHTLEVEMTAA